MVFELGDRLLDLLVERVEVTPASLDAGAADVLTVGLAIHEVRTGTGGRPNVDEVLDSLLAVDLIDVWPVFEYCQLFRECSPVALIDFVFERSRCERFVV